MISTAAGRSEVRGQLHSSHMKLAECAVTDTHVTADLAQDNLELSH